MSRPNVRCAGNEQWHEPAPGRHQLPVTPCGWKGSRKNTDGWQGPLHNEMQCCPRCGGRVELIPEES